jgi:hypothetical protein
VCIKDINISNIGGRVDLKVTFSQQNTEQYKQKRSSLRLSVWVNNQVEPASVEPTKQLLEESEKKSFQPFCGKNYNMLYLYVEAVIFKIWKYTPHKQAIL